LIERAGGVTDFAYLEGASLQRTISDARIALDNNQASEDTQETIEGMLEEDSSITGKALEAVKERGAKKTSLNFSNYVGIRLNHVLNKPHSKEDLLMEEGDVIIIPRQLQTVTVRGEVLNSNRIVYRKGKSLKYYINQAGGFTSKAHKSKTFVQYANGEVKATVKGLGRIYPVVKPGAEIVVPQKSQKDRIAPQAIIGMTSGVVSMFAILVSLLRN